jgi:hypothetical protein
MDVSPHMVPRMSSRGRKRPPQQSGEDELMRLADELSEREGIPIEAAYSIVQRHGTRGVKEARNE